MGNFIDKIFFKTGKEVVISDVSSFWELSAVDIDGKVIGNLGEIAGKKCTLVVNVASN